MAVELQSAALIGGLRKSCGVWELIGSRLVAGGGKRRLRVKRRGGGKGFGRENV